MDQKKLRIQTLFTQWYIDVKETMKELFLVRMKEACGDALSLEPILSFKKNLEGKSVVTNGDLWAPLDFRTPPFFIDDSDAEFHPD